MNWFASQSIRFRIISGAVTVSIFIVVLAILGATNSDKSSNNEIIYILSAFAVIISIGMSVWLSTSIRLPLEQLRENAEKIAAGEVNIKISESGENSIGRLEKAFITIVESLKEQTEVAESIANGDLSRKVKIKSEKDYLSKAMIKVNQSLNELINEAKNLSEAAVNGKLSVRSDVNKFKGAYREIISGVNSTLDAFVNPFNEAVNVLGKMSAGDLTVKIDGNYIGDFSVLKNNVNKLAESFNNALSDVSNAIQATATASNEISSSSEEMAAGAQEQSSQTTEVASAVEQMTKTIMETTKNSSRAAEAAKNSGTIAREGGKVVSETIEGMNRVAEVVKKSADTVQALGKSSDAIGEIIQVIDDIADQTNLLALNAAIEAARAGEQGRGFAVVADEVRKLAERTTKATKEIAGMIKKIQQDTSDAVISMTAGTVEVEKGKELANLAGKSLSEIIGGAEQVVDMATQVAAASEQQSSAAEEISKNVDAINHVTQETASGIQQIAHAAEDLNRLTVSLQEMISRFKISGVNENQKTFSTKRYSMIK